LKTFKVIGTNKPQKAGGLALRIMQNLPEEVPNTDDEPEYDDIGDVKASDEEAHQLLLFLWAVQNLCASKVDLNDTPTSELFEGRARANIAEMLEGLKYVYKVSRKVHRAKRDRD
jgi:hypothetical protein